MAWRRDPLLAGVAVPEPTGAALTVDADLRRQCLEWAFQTRDFSDAPHAQVISIAQSYYEFIINGQMVKRVGEREA